MIKFSRWYSCVNTAPKKDGDYLVMRLDKDGELSYAANLHYTVKYGWNTRDDVWNTSNDSVIVFDKDNEYDRRAMWTKVYDDKKGKKNDKVD